MHNVYSAIRSSHFPPLLYLVLPDNIKQQVSTQASFVTSWSPQAPQISQLRTCLTKEPQSRWIISFLRCLRLELPCHPFIMVQSGAKANICWVPLRVEERNWNVTFFIAVAPSFRQTYPARGRLIAGEIEFESQFSPWIRHSRLVFKNDV